MKSVYKWEYISSLFWSFKRKEEQTHPGAVGQTQSWVSMGSHSPTVFPIPKQTELSAPTQKPPETPLCVTAAFSQEWHTTSKITPSVLKQTSHVGTYCFFDNLKYYGPGTAETLVSVFCLWRNLAKMKQKSSLTAWFSLLLMNLDKSECQWNAFSELRYTRR